MQPRRNGLSAASYVPLRDIDPRLTDAALEALQDAGVAAYAVPASNPLVLGFEVVASTRPVDRLYVDTAAVDAARQIINRSFPEGEDAPTGDERVSVGPTGEGPAEAPDLDTAFEQIVAGFDSAEEHHRWPAEEDASSADEAEPPAPPARLAPGAPDDEDHFVPPPPPPLPELEPVTKLAWAGVIGGPLLLLGTLFGLSLPQWMSTLAIVSFVAGFATLVARLKDHPDGADPDDGAVV